MKNKLIKSIENDLGLTRFIDELECDYFQRLIYSSGAAWAKALVYGNSYADYEAEYEYANTDIMYIESHLSKILESFLKSFKINPHWMGDKSDASYFEQARTLASCIIKDVLYSYNLAKVGSRRITSVDNSFIKYSENAFLVRGEVFKSKNIFSVGVAQWKIAENVDNYSVDRKIINVSGEDYYKIMHDEFDWWKTDLTGKYLMFQKGSIGAYSRCWKLIDIKDLSEGINILKVDDINGGYLLTKKENGELYIVELDPWYIDKREIYRILYGLNYNNGTPAEYKIMERSDHIIVNFSSALPEYEDRIIKSCSWPYSKYDSDYSRIIPRFLWSIVEDQITCMGIKLVVQ